LLEEVDVILNDLLSILGVRLDLIIQGLSVRRVEASYLFNFFKVNNPSLTCRRLLDLLEQCSHFWRRWR